MARSLRSLWNAATRPGDLPTDAELLGRFADSADHSAFELLVRRHAAAVWAACRGVLRNDTDADDAAQVTFFTLARHARRVKAGANLGGWLHRVAVNAALKLRAKRRPSTALPDLFVSPTEADDSAAVLHEELTKLPAAYREVLVTVDLEGYGHADAAKVLGWPVGTVSGRVVRARAELRRRLERRGVTASLLVATVGGSSIQAAVEMAVGAVVAPPEVVSLSSEVWAMITTAKRRLVGVFAASLLGLVLVGGAGVVAVAQTPKAAPKADKPGDKKPPEVSRKEVKNLEDLPAVEVAEGDSFETKTAKKYLLASKERYRIIQTRIEGGQFTGGGHYLQLTDTLRELTTAAEELYPDPNDQLPWFEFRLAATNQALAFVAPRVKNGVEEPQLVPQMEAEQAKAELALLKLKKKLKK